MGCVTNPIWTNVTCPGAGWIHQNDKWLYTRSGSLPTGADSLMYDLCRVVVAFANVQGLAFPASVGNLWAEYEVCFDGPKVSDAVPSSLFTSSVTALTDPTPLPTGASYLNGGPNGPWTQVQFRAGSSDARYVPIPTPEAYPGTTSGLAIGDSGYYKITTQMYFQEGSGVANFWPNAWQAFGNAQISTVEQYTSEGPIGGTGAPSPKFSERIQYAYVPGGDSIVSDSGTIIGDYFLKSNGGSGEPSQEDAESQITNIIVWVEPIELGELQLLGVYDLGPGSSSSSMSMSLMRDRFSSHVARDKTFSHRFKRAPRAMTHVPQIEQQPARAVDPHPQPQASKGWFSS